MSVLGYGTGSSITGYATLVQLYKAVIQQASGGIIRKSSPHGLCWLGRDVVGNSVAPSRWIKALRSRGRVS